MKCKITISKLVHFYIRPFVPHSLNCDSIIQARFNLRDKKMLSFTIPRILWGFRFKKVHELIDVFGHIWLIKPLGANNHETLSWTHTIILKMFNGFCSCGKLWSRHNKAITHIHLF